MNESVNLCCLPKKMKGIDEITINKAENLFHK